MNAVAGGLAEVGILSDAVDTGALVLRPFAVDRLVAVMAPCRPLARERRLSLSPGRERTPHRRGGRATGASRRSCGAVGMPAELSRADAQPGGRLPDGGAGRGRRHRSRNRCAAIQGRREAGGDTSERTLGDAAAVAVLVRGARADAGSDCTDRGAGGCSLTRLPGPANGKRSARWRTATFTVTPWRRACCWRGYAGRGSDVRRGDGHGRDRRR